MKVKSTDGNLKKYHAAMAKVRWRLERYCNKDVQMEFEQHRDVKRGPGGVLIPEKIKTLQIKLVNKKLKRQVASLQLIYTDNFAETLDSAAFMVSLSMTPKTCKWLGANCV